MYGMGQISQITSVSITTLQDYQQTRDNFGARDQFSLGCQKGDGCYIYNNQPMVIKIFTMTHKLSKIYYEK